MILNGAGKFRGYSTYNPHTIYGNRGGIPLNIAGLAINTWHEIGPPGSGATNEWDMLAALYVPKGAVGFVGLLLTSNRSTTTGTFSITVNANHPDTVSSGGSGQLGDESRLFTHTRYPGAVPAETNSEGGQRETEVRIPLSKDRRFWIRWTTAGTGNSAVQLDLIRSIY